MVFSRYNAVLRCCGLKNSAKSIPSSTSSQLSFVSIFTPSNNNNVDKKRKNGYSTLAVNNENSETMNTGEPKPSSNMFLLSNDENANYDDSSIDERLKELDKTGPGIFDDCVEDLSHIGPELPETFNFAAYANKSPTIKKLVELGVDFYKIERRKGLAEMLMPLEFERDMKLHIRFLNDCGVPPDKLGKFLTVNPKIFKEDLDDLYTRIRYLRAHKFDKSMIARIVCENPYWVTFQTNRIDARLGFFQKEFQLSGGEVRSLATKQPRLITYQMEHLKKSTFAVREEMGFDKFQTKMMLINKPRIWMKTQRSIVECFDYVHNHMNIPHSVIAEQPEILTYRLHRIKQRHMFLETQKRAQYDPTQPLYVSLQALTGNTDAEFCLNVAKTSVETFNLFLKTL